jgi:hypothetical protein
MTQFDTRKLDYLDTFPNLDLSLVNGEEMRIPDDVRGSWTVLLLYRGHW